MLQILSVSIFEKVVLSRLLNDEYYKKPVIGVTNSTIQLTTG